MGINNSFGFLTSIIQTKDEIKIHLYQHMDLIIEELGEHKSKHKEILDQATSTKNLAQKRSEYMKK